MTESIDQTDREIMSILQKNSRVSNTEIAKRLDISEGTVRNRIKKLVDNRIIRNISVINPEALGYLVHLIVGLQIEYAKLARVVERLKKIEAIHFLGYATGKHDLIAIMFFRDAEEQLHFYQDELPSIDGITRIETFNILKMLKTKYQWGVSLSSFKPDMENDIKSSE